MSVAIRKEVCRTANLQPASLKLPEVLNQDIDIVSFTETAEGTFLNLTHAFACEAHIVCNFFGSHFVATDTEEHFQHGAFTVIEHSERCFEV
jgi:hypothetical protein